MYIIDKETTKNPWNIIKSPLISDPKYLKKFTKILPLHIRTLVNEKFIENCILIINISHFIFLGSVHYKKENY